MEEDFGKLNASIQQTIEGDSEFQETLVELEEPAKVQKLEEKKQELLGEHWKKLSGDAKKQAELANNYKVRAEKAEKESKEKVDTEKDGLTTKDVLFLSKSDIHPDNLDEVMEWAKFKKVSVQDAYGQLKPKLDVEAEQRRSAAATQTQAGQRGTAAVSGEELHALAQRTGEVPDNAEGMRALFKAKLARKLK